MANKREETGNRETGKARRGVIYWQRRHTRGFAEMHNCLKGDNLFSSNCRSLRLMGAFAFLEKFNRAITVLMTPLPMLLTSPLGGRCQGVP